MDDRIELLGPGRREVPDVELAALGYLGRARIAEVRVVRPHDDPRRAGALLLPIESMALDQAADGSA